MMHKASLMKDLMSNMESLAAMEGASRISHVNVWLGALSHMSAEHFRENFIEISKSTLAEGATLVVEVSRDIGDPNAQKLLLRGVEVEL